MSTKSRPRPFECTACGQTAAKWLGRCPGCGGWGTIEEGLPTTAAAVGTPGAAPKAAARPASPVRAIGEVGLESVTSRPTGVGELDRVLGGGLVPGAVVLLAGEPGVGKSTLLLEVAARRARAGGTVLYVTGEESAGQVRLRAERTDAVVPHLFLSATADLEEVAAHVEAVDPGLLVVDSVQTVGSADIEGTAGGVAQVRAVTSALVALAKQRDLPVVLIGHVTKDGAVAGPRTLEHLVDVVLSFEGERHSTLRMVRGLKNRFGPSDEVGCFEMFDGGITEVTDPTGLFVGTMTGAVPGQAVTVAMEGKRPLMAEVQGLVSRVGQESQPRRSVSDLESSRVLKILAVLQQRCSLSLATFDVFAATVGGMKLREPSADLAIALAIASAAADRPLPYGTVVIGEVGLTGEVRRVPATDRRLAEAARMGIPKAIVPFGPGTTAPPGMSLTEVDDLKGALAAVGLGGGATKKRS
ncbi:DNA repair protein RadA [Actinomycetospora termitidis]|uniref:DNA repair protein RadA n=1 Tax=Actinomycetospora termitidis TaxID=3053470 RepID=A0ABT7MAE3_9PSEU|nr:DNA repair protein RadA [Actinomycetospora sp. Odt1-22]MDL5157628.1 DNA repair protein RadA [Actinomycetospora sp. Odt1-22]